MPTLGGLPPAEKYTTLRGRNTQHEEEDSEKEKYTILRRRNTKYIKMFKEAQRNPQI